MPHGIDLGFLKGSKMEDGLKLLTGNGKAIRVLSITNLDEDVVGYYVGQAVKLNLSAKL